MYVLNDFVVGLRSFVRAHAQLDVDVKLPMVKQSVNGHIRFYSSKDLQSFAEKILDNFVTVDICSYTPGYVSIWLKKKLWMSNVIQEILNSGSKYGSNVDYNGTVVSVDIEECNDLVTSLRMALLKDTIQNLAAISGCTIDSNGLNLIVSKRNKKNSNLILCGSVICNSTVKEYEERKKNDIAKMSANRIDSDEYPIDIISKLCRASIVYELLSVRHNKVVNTECNTSNKDSGIFIMYNYSRLCQIWAAYEKGVIENFYKPLPDINTVNFGLLTSEEEWILIFNHLSVYPSVIVESVKCLLSATVEVHKLCKFLMEMSSVVSLFYHRYHILSDPIPSLLPLMYARLYLVKTLVQVYENVFQLLGIEVVCEM